MKNRIVSMSLAVVLMLSVSFSSCANEEVPEITEYTLTVSSTEGGSVTDPGEGTFGYDERTVVNLVAEAEEGYRFVNWTGDVDTVDDVNAAETTITILGDYEIAARFMSVIGSKTEAVANGVVDARDETDTELLVSGNAIVTVARFSDNPGGTPLTGFHSLGKYVDVYIPDVANVTKIEIRLYYTPDEVRAGVDEGSLQLFWWNGIMWKPCDPTGVNTTDRYVWAQIGTEGSTPTLAQLTGTPFAAYGSPSPLYNLVISSTEGGNVTTPGEGPFTYDEGTAVDLVAEAEQGYYFVNWTGDVSTVANVSAATTTITMNGNYSITANFEEIAPGQFGLTIASTAGGSVTVPGEGTFAYDAGIVINLVASPASGYRFVNWTGDVDTVANVDAASTTITMNDNYSITANFEELPQYDLTVSGTAGGSVTNPGKGTFTYYVGTVVNLAATPADGYRFVDWTGNVGTIANVNAASTAVTMNGDYSITANFIAQHQLTISSTTGGSVTTPGQGSFTYDRGTVASLVATPDAYYQFANWTGNVGTVANINAASTTVIMNGDYSITANFEEEEAVTFPDPNLEAAIREAIGKPEGLIYPSDLDDLTSLDAWGRNIADLTGLEHCTKLTWLEIYGNEISDISPLANLANLTYIVASDNQISDISPLANLTNLTVLVIETNQISDISPLTNLTNLGWLGLSYNRISNISPLANRTSLTNLYAYDNQISDISPLANLMNLERLFLSGNQISSISPLANLTKLTVLQITDNQIGNISPLSGLTRLTELWLDGNQISDFSPLSNLTDLTTLTLIDTSISNISPLANLTRLTVLQLMSNQIGNISPLANLTNLTWLHLGFNQIGDVSPLANLTNLETLYLWGNQISDISPLVQNSGLAAGDWVNLMENPLSSDSINTYIPQLQARGVTVQY